MHPTHRSDAARHGCASHRARSPSVEVGEAAKVLEGVEVEVGEARPCSVRWRSCGWESARAAERPLSSEARAASAAVAVGEAEADEACGTCAAASHAGRASSSILA